MARLNEEMRRRLGAELTQKIFTLFAGRDIYVPSKALWETARRNRQIAALRSEGLSVRDLSERFGLSPSQIRRIASGRGGCRRTIEAVQRLEARLGQEDAAKLVDAFSGACLYIPISAKAIERAQRNAEIRAAYNGANTAQLAMGYRLSRRQIYAILKRGEGA